MTKIISILSVAAIALSACASASEPTIVGEQHTVPAGESGQSLGVRSYDITQGVSATQIILRGSTGVLGSIVSQQIGAGKSITVTGAGPTFTIELYADQVRVLENGVERATYAQGTGPDTWAQTPELAAGLELLTAVASDGVLHDALDTMRANVNPDGSTAYMFGLGDCPGWVVVGACLSGVGAPVCAYCFIAWL